MEEVGGPSPLSPIMPYKVTKLQNASPWSDETPDIVIKEGDPEWDEAYQNWKSGKNPTNDKLWKKAVIACTETIENG